MCGQVQLISGNGECICRMGRRQVSNGCSDGARSGASMRMRTAAHFRQRKTGKTSNPRPPSNRLAITRQGVVNAQNRKSLGLVQSQFDCLLTSRLPAARAARRKRNLGHLMSVVRCSHCRRDHMHYPNNGIVPRAYCSLICWLARRRNGRRFTGDMQGMNVERCHEIMAELRAHLLQDHQEVDVTNWHPNCKQCEGLDARLANALAEVV